MPAAASLAAEGLEEQDPQAVASAAEVEVQSAAEVDTLPEEAVQVRRSLLQCSTYSGHSQAMKVPAWGPVLSAAGSLLTPGMCSMHL